MKKTNPQLTRLRRERTTDSLADMRGAFYDLWMDTEERPRMPASHRAIRKMIRRHLSTVEERRFVELQKTIDRGLSKDDIEGTIIPAQKRLHLTYKALEKAIFG